MRRSALVFLAAALLALSACSRSRRPRPSILLISIDTLRADHLPAWGYRGVETPNIDSLRKDAIRFSSAYSQVPLTLASHAALMTGLLPPENGVRDNFGFTLAPGTPTLASVLRASGYATGAAVSAAVLTRRSGIDQGFDFYDDAVEEGTRVERDGGKTADSLLGWLETARGRPFFAFLHLFEPHAPYEPPEPWKSRYAKNPYDGEIARADEIVGRVLERLRQAGLYDEAIVVLLSDHGEGLGDHGEREHGVFLYREAIHVPLLVKLPGSARRGGTVDAPVALVDVFPTLAALAGVPPPARLSGRDLSAGSRGLDPHRAVYSETLYPRLRLGWSDLASLIDDRHHYIEAPRPELYDVVSDPGERHDLSAGLPPAFRSLRLELSRIPRPFSLPSVGTPEQAKKLASLGYLTVTSPDAARAGLPDPKDKVGLIDGRLDFQRLIAAGDDRALESAAREFVAKVPAALDVWRVMADALERQGRRTEAIAALEKGLAASSPTAVPTMRDLALERLVTLLARAGRRSEVLQIAATITRWTDPEAANAAGVVYGEAGQAGQARQSFERALALDPGDPTANLNLGLLLLRSGDAAAAKERLERAVSVRPDVAAAWNALGQARSTSGDETGALACWQKAVSLDARQYDALFNLAIASGRAGDAAAARRALERFLATAPAGPYGREREEARRLLSGLEAPAARRPS
jgi:choline-sulfatase